MPDSTVRPEPSGQHDRPAENAAFAELSAAAHASLDQLLRELAAGRFAAETTPLDTLFAYRLLLWRNPDRADADFLRQRAAEFPAAADLARGFLSSREFSQNYHGVSRRPDGRVVIARDGDLRIAVDLDDLAIGWRIINGDYETETRALIERLTPQGGLCVDLGANAGYFTALMARAAGPNGRVIAYEPFPRVHDMLQLTLAESGLAGRVDARRKACSDRPGETRMFYAAEADNLGGMFISARIDPAHTPLQSVVVPMTTLDADLAGERRVDLIKMDVEGAELRALRGMTRRLESDRPILVAEINVPCLAREQTTPDEVIGFLRDRGYAVKLVTGAQPDGLVPIEGPYANYTSSPVENVLCTPCERDTAQSRG